VGEPRRSGPPPKRGPFARLAGAGLAFGFWVLLGAFGNIVVEWMGMRLLWPEQGVKHSFAALDEELRYLDRDFPEGVLIRRPARFARDLAAGVYATAYQDWHLGALAGGAASGRPADPHTFRGQVREFLGGGGEYLLAAVIATQIYALRLGVLMAATPVFVLAGLVAVADGLGQRDLRRFGGGRERGQVYHLARGLVFPAFTAPWLLYLAWPTAVHPNAFVLPFALLFGGAIRIMTSSFKKYL
jgi:integrating conjugative element membrane protein (TIGR03747 family)